MALSDLTQDSVLQALAEFDRLGRDVFLNRYEFGKARGYFLLLHRLGDDKTEIVCQAVRKPLAPVGGGIDVTECGFHPHVSIAYLDRANRYVVCPQVEGAAAFEIEAGVVPVTGQDAILDAAAFERETH